RRRGLSRIRIIPDGTRISSKKQPFSHSLARTRKGATDGTNNRIDLDARPRDGNRRRVMSITALWQTVRGGWHNLVKNVWPDSPEEQTRAEIARLNHDLSRRAQRLIELRRRIEQVRDRLQGQTEEVKAERSRRRLDRLEAVYQ